ncbi:MAG: Abi-alpha family protein [Solirubrobacteraceae bacterium]
MGDEIELAAKTSGEVVAALAEKSGSLAIPREYASYIAARIHLRHYPALVERAMAVAVKLQAMGLPRRAFSALDEPLLTAILEGMAEETNHDLQEAWENLLANTLAEGSTDVRRGFPGILRRLDPRDARLLDHWTKDTRAEKVYVELHTTMPGERDGPALDTLTALGLLRPHRRLPTTLGSIDDDGSTTIIGYSISELGWAFVQACRMPHRSIVSKTNI